jgi:hypothetical protein
VLVPPGAVAAAVAPLVEGLPAEALLGAVAALVDPGAEGALVDGLLDPVAAGEPVDPAADPPLELAGKAPAGEA